MNNTDRKPKGSFAKLMSSDPISSQEPALPIDKEQSNKNDTVVPRHQAIINGTTTPSNHDTMQPKSDEEVAEKVRKAVKQFGKEAATYRFTLEEKTI